MNVFYEEDGAFKVGAVLADNNTSLQVEAAHGKRSKIKANADRAVSAERAKGASAPRPAAKSAIQSEVWKSRDAKWVELDGEGAQEAAK